MELVEDGAAAQSAAADVLVVKCYCCGLAEECTPGYVEAVKGKNLGRWLCGLCTAGINYSMEKGIGKAEAVEIQASFHKKFRMSSPAEAFLSATKQLLRNASPRKTEFGCRPFGRSKSCFAGLASDGVVTGDNKYRANVGE